MTNLPVAHRFSGSFGEAIDYFDPELRAEMEQLAYAIAVEFDLGGADELFPLIGGGWYTTDLKDSFWRDGNGTHSTDEAARWFYTGDTPLVGLGIGANVIDVVRTEWHHAGLVGPARIWHEPVASISRSQNDWDEQLSSAITMATRQARARFTICWDCRTFQYAWTTRPEQPFVCRRCMEWRGTIFD